MLWSIFRLIRVAGRVGGFNAFVSILDLDVVLQPVDTLLFPFPSKVNAEWGLTGAKDSPFLTHLALPIIWLACTVTGRSWGPFFPQWQEGLSSVNLQSSFLCCFQSLLMSCSCRWCFSLGPANMPPIQPEVGIAAFCRMSSQFIKYVQILDFIMCWPVLLMPHASLATSVRSSSSPLPPWLDQLIKL